MERLWMNARRDSTDGPENVDELVFPANVKFADIVPVVETFLNKDQALFRVQGSVGIDTPIGVIPFSSMNR